MYRGFGVEKLIVKDLKALYKRDKQLAIKAAKVLGLRIAATNNNKKAENTEERKIRKKGEEERKKNAKKLHKNLPLITQKLKNIGYALGPQIAPGGRYGAAFDVGDRKVLKITLDPAEAEASDKIKQHGLKHSVIIYRIFRFKDLKDFYFILQERLLPINKLEKEIVTALKRLLKYSKYSLPEYIKYSKSFDQIKDPETYTLLKSNRSKFEPAVRGFLIKMFVKNQILPKDLKSIVLESQFMNQFFDTINEFREAGISKLDLHAGNVMQDSDRVVKLIDFGFRITFDEKKLEKENK